MTYKKEIKHLSKSIIDNLKDAKMLFEYAREAKENQNTEIANYFFMKAKTRIQMLNEDHQKAVDLIKKEELESKQTYPEGKWDCLHEYLMKEKEGLDYSIQNFKL